MNKNWSLQNGMRADRVGDYCYEELLAFRHGVSARKAVDGMLRRNSVRHIPGTTPDPAGFTNCYPPSTQCAERVLSVPDHRAYIVDVCPTGCIHWWTFMEDNQKHFARCKGCMLCRCPHCDSSRFISDKKGVRGAQSCWLFFDALQTMFLNPELAEAMLSGRWNRDDPSHPDCPAFGKWHEYKRLKKVLPELGFRLQDVRLLHWKDCCVYNCHRPVLVSLVLTLFFSISCRYPCGKWPAMALSWGTTIQSTCTW
jgi:hypothetical protein